MRGWCHRECLCLSWPRGWPNGGRSSDQGVGRSGLCRVWDRVGKVCLFHPVPCVCMCVHVCAHTALRWVSESSGCPSATSAKPWPLWGCIAPLPPLPCPLEVAACWGSERGTKAGETGRSTHRLSEHPEQLSTDSQTIHHICATPWSRLIADPQSRPTYSPRAQLLGKIFPNQQLQEAASLESGNSRAGPRGCVCVIWKGFIFL